MYFTPQYSVKKIDDLLSDLSDKSKTFVYNSSLYSLLYGSLVVLVV